MHTSFQKSTLRRNIKWIDLDIECKTAINNLILVVYVVRKRQKKGTGNYQIRDAFAILGNDWLPVSHGAAEWTRSRGGNSGAKKNLHANFPGERVSEGDREVHVILLEFRLKRHSFIPCGRNWPVDFAVSTDDRVPFIIIAVGTGSSFDEDMGK